MIEDCGVERLVPSASDVVAECEELRRQETQFTDGTAHAGIYYESGNTDCCYFRRHIIVPVMMGWNGIEPLSLLLVVHCCILGSLSLYQ